MIAVWLHAFAQWLMNHPWFGATTSLSAGIQPLGFDTAALDPVNALLLTLGRVIAVGIGLLTIYLKLKQVFAKVPKNSNDVDFN